MANLYSLSGLHQLIFIFVPLLLVQVKFAVRMLSSSLVPLELNENLICSLILSSSGPLAQVYMLL